MTIKKKVISNKAHKVSQKVWKPSPNENIIGGKLSDKQEK